MKKLAIISTLLFSSYQSFAMEFAIGPSIGFQGIGIEGSTSINKNLNLRLGIAGFSFSADNNIDLGMPDVNVKVKTDFTFSNLSIPLLLDYHPFENSFRISAGITYHNLKLASQATPQQNIYIDEVMYTPYQIGRISNEITTARKIAPVLSIGYGQPFVEDSNLSFSWDLGVIFTGKLTQKTSITGTLKDNSDVVNDLGNEVIDEVNKYWPGVFPILSFGLKYKF